MAMGVPVVCSKNAANGVDAIPGEHLVTADTADSYVNAIINILDNEGERQRLATDARNRVLAHHSWDSSMHRLDGIVASLGQSQLPGMPAIDCQAESYRN